MGSLDRRIQGLEKQLASPGKDKPCPECGEHILVIEWRDEGKVTYPLGEPCESCEGGPGVHYIEVVMEDELLDGD